MHGYATDFHLKYCKHFIFSFCCSKQYSWLATRDHNVTRTYILIINRFFFFYPQTVHRSIRIVRDCGYVEDPAHDDQDCYGRLGSHDIDVTHCSCTSDMCNGSTNVISNGPSYTTFVAMIATTAVIAMDFFLNIQH